MATGGIYEVGTVSFTSPKDVVGTGTFWTPVVAEGDWLFVGGQVGLIKSVVDDSHLTLESDWFGATPTDDEYVIIKMSWLRYDPALTQAKVRELLEELDAQGNFLFVEGDQPDPAVGSVGQWALKTNVSPWQIWYKEPPEPGNWVAQAPPAGIRWAGIWSAATTYGPADAVEDQGASYISKTTNLNKRPATNLSDWDLMAAQGGAGPPGPPGVGIVWRGNWSNLTNYAINDAVADSGASYIAIAASGPGNGGASHPPSVKWNVLAQAGTGGGSGTGLVSIGDVPPASPTIGQLWWESDTGGLYIWYDDGTSLQWVAAMNKTPAGVPPSAPVLTLTSSTTDTTPDFTLAGDLVLGDLVRFQYSTSAAFTGASELTNTIDAAEDAANTIAFTTGALALGTWYFRTRIERGGLLGDWSNTETIVLVAAVSYSGPGDVVGVARSWVGLRGYSAAYAASGGPALDLHNDTTGAFAATINILANGSLDVATATPIISGGATKIGKLYDQTGNGNHLIQATNANRPTLVLGGLGSFPAISFDGIGTYLRNSATFENAPGATLSTVGNSVNSGGQQSLCLAGQQIGYNNSGANTVFLYAGSVLTAAATDGTWHAIQGVFGTTTANSILNVDNVSTVGNAGTDITGVASVNFGATDIGSQAFKGKAVECGYWATTAFSGPQCTAMYTNQHAYWGF